MRNNGTYYFSFLLLLLLIINSDYPEVHFVNNLVPNINFRLIARKNKPKTKINAESPIIIPDWICSKSMVSICLA